MMIEDSEHTKDSVIAQSNMEEVASVAFEKFQSEMAIHQSASRAILTNICQRLANLEVTVSNLQKDMVESKKNTDVTEDLNEVKKNVSTISNLIETFQTEMQHQKDNIILVSTSVNEAHLRVDDVNKKIDEQNENYIHRFNKLHERIDEIPRTITALHENSSNPSSVIDSAPPSLTLHYDDSKLSLERHMKRKQDEEKSRKRECGPFTDLLPFTIPDDMKKKIQTRIGSRKDLQNTEDEKSLQDLMDAYARIQFFGGGLPRIVELQAQVEECRGELRKAMNLVRTSNVQLYICCESKVDKVDLLPVQIEMKHLDKRLKEVEHVRIEEERHTRILTRAPLIMPSSYSSGTEPNGRSTINLSLQGTNFSDLSIASSPSMQHEPKVKDFIHPSQLSSLRVSLLELSRNFHLLKLNTTKKRPMDMLLKAHVDNVVAKLHEAYAAATAENIDLACVTKHVDQVARLLGSAFSSQIVAMSGDYKGPPLSGASEVASATELVIALNNYKEAFTSVLKNEFSNQEGVPQDTLSRLAGEIEELTKGQKILESKIESLTCNKSKGSELDAENTLNTKNGSADLGTIRQELDVIKRHYVTDEMFASLVHQLESKTSTSGSPLSLLVPPMTGMSMVTPSPVHIEFDALSLDIGERQKSFKRLDPLFHIPSPQSPDVKAKNHSSIPMIGGGFPSKGLCSPSKGRKFPSKIPRPGTQDGERQPNNTTGTIGEWRSGTPSQVDVIVGNKVGKKT